jgi:hypothetical protein
MTCAVVKGVDGINKVGLQSLCASEHSPLSANSAP